MKKQPTDHDENLVNFIKTNRPNIAPASPDLEERILQAIELDTPSPVNHFLRHNPAKYKRLWFLPPAIAVGIMFVISIDGLPIYNILSNNFAPKETTNESELASLETTLETNWDSVINHNQTEEDFDPIAAQNLLILTNSQSQNNAKLTSNRTTARR